MLESTELRFLKGDGVVKRFYSFLVMGLCGIINAKMQLRKPNANTGFARWHQRMF